MASTKNLGQLEGPVLLFGGPYSNLPATQAMRREANRLGIPPCRVICTGDLVAYCAEPEATTELIVKSGIEVVMGNCEESLATDSADCGCGFDQGMECSVYSDRWYRYANENVTTQTRAWMARLP